VRISYAWLKEFLGELPPPADLASRLTMAGLEVEAVEAVGGDFSQVVVGRVETTAPHPISGKLTCCRVTVGGEPLPIVCGAPNVRAGDWVPVALPGAVLPGGRRIEATPIQGERSQGMLCSERELGLGPDGDGILILPGPLTLGRPLQEALPVADHLLGIAVTPNRGDCLSHLGVAREVAVLTGSRLTVPRRLPREGKEAAKRLAGVQIADPDLCPRYVARVMRGVRVGPSPFWLRRRLEACGIRPINNVVDATNYVMLEVGQPIHAFDLSLLKERRVVVRRARAGEHLTTLDGVTRPLSSGMLVIADAADPVAVAGVMGGAGTEVRPDSTDLLLESAIFDPLSVRRTAKALGLLTEASYRFERGVDPGAPAGAADRVAHLIQETAGGTVAPGLLDAKPVPLVPRRVTLRLPRAAAILGAPVEAAAASRILRGLGFAVRRGRGRSLALTVPSWRADVTREIDVIEEVARVQGFEKIPASLPAGRAVMPARLEERRLEGAVRRLLVASGYQEVVNFSFTREEAFDTFTLPPGHPLRDAVRIRNPLGGGETLLRTFLLPALLQDLLTNERHGIRSAWLFEVAHVYRPIAGERLPREEGRLAAVASGARGWIHWSGDTGAVDFFDAKGTLEALGRTLGIPIAFGAEGHVPYLHPGRQAVVLAGGEAVGSAGEVHPEVCARLGLGGRPAAFEVDLDRLLARATPVAQHRPLPRFPAVIRDVAVLVPADLPAARVRAVIEAAGGALVEAVTLFDLYEGEKIPAGHRSLAFSVAYRAADRTLTDAEVNAAHGEVLARLQAELGASIR
jgi:phenylalanyl-tRNA synthetase beta chain